MSKLPINDLLTPALTSLSEAREDSIIEYPIRFPVKVMGLHDVAFSREMLDVVRIHAPDFDERDLDVRASSGGKYQSLTFTITATSREQLDALYRSLSSHPLAKYVL